MSNLVLGTALELARWLGPSAAAAFLEDEGIASEVAKELLAKEMQLYPPSIRCWPPSASDKEQDSS